MDDTIGHGGPPGGGPSLDPPRYLETGTLVAERYRLLEHLPAGGMSRLYVANDERLGRRVALKFLDAARFSGRADANVARRRFFREARLSASLVHPHIVPIHDLGELDGVPYMVLHLVDGPTLGRLIRDGITPPLGAAVQTMREIALALAFAHAHGVLHRDIKPDNIMLERGDHAWLLDFGLARFLSQSRDTFSGHAVGTPAYIAPETLEGEESTAATDIFSAGLTFYEWLTGRYPYPRESLYYSIAFVEVPAPSSLRPEIPRALEAVLLRMLAKKPKDRYAGFDEVGRDLGRVHESLATGGTALHVEVEGLLAWEGAAERTQLALPFVGRDDAMQQIEHALARAGAGTGAAFAVSGDAGGGKTRLVDEVIRRARLRQFATFVGAAVETRGDHPYQPFVRLLRHWAAQNGIRTIADLELHCETRAPGLAGGVTVLAGLLALSPSSPRDKDQLWETLARFLASLAGERPALVVLEDFHYADAASLNVLRYLLHDLGRQRLVVVVTYRPESEAAASLGSELATTGILTLLALAPLSPGAVDQLTAGLLVDPEESARLSPVLHRESQGNPLFIAELLKLMKARGTLIPHGPGYRLAADPTTREVPEEMRSIIRRRLERLSAVEREILDVAAVEGDRFSSDSVVAATRARRLDVLRTLQDLERRHHMVRSEGEAGYRFVHDRVREVVYEEISPPLKAEYHAILAERLAARAGEQDAPLLARHYEAAGQPARAASWLRRAAALAKRNFAFETAEANLVRALDLAPDDDRLSALLLLGEAQLALGKTDVAQATLADLLRTADDAGDRTLQARAHHYLARVAEQRAQLQLAIEHADRGLECLGELDQGILRGDLHRTRALCLAATGQGALAIEEFEKAASALRIDSAVAPADLARSFYLLGANEGPAGRFEPAAEHLAQAERLARELDDLDTVTRALVSRARLASARGRPHERLALLEQARIAVEHQGLTLRVEVECNVARAACALGHLSAAAEYSVNAIRLARRTLARRLLLSALINRLDYCTESGSLQGGVESLAEAEGVSLAADANTQVLAIESGVLHWQLGDHEAGTRILEPFSTRPDFLAGFALLCLGWIALETEPGQAHPLLARALPLIDRPDAIIAQGRVRAAAARSLALSGAGAAAREMLAAIPAAARESLLVGRESAFAEAVIAEAERQLEAALHHAGQALTIARATGARLTLVETLLLLVRLHQQGGDAATVADLRSEAVRVTLEVAAELVSPAHRKSFLSRNLFASIRDQLPIGQQGGG